MRANPLSKEQILEAHGRTKSNRAAARYLGVSWMHYKRYAKLYKNDEGKTLFEEHLNPHGKGIPKFLSNSKDHRKVGNIHDVLEGRIPIEHFTPERIRDKIITEGLLIEECCKCGMHERRVLDYRMPLILNFKDGNKKNWKLPNLELICYNCYFLFINDLFTPKQINHIEDYKPSPETRKIDWELDEKFEEHFKKLNPNLYKQGPEDGSEFISKK
jgi:hypothetical protein